jgi:hypothetical protein
MSTEEQDALVGRLVREQAERKVKLAALDARRAEFQKAFAALANAIDTNVNSALYHPSAVKCIDAAPLSELDLRPLRELLLSIAHIHREVSDAALQLKSLGV